MKKDPEPLIELLYQEFPKTDPVEIERITKTVIKWLEQKHKYYKKMNRQIAKKLGEKDTGTLVSNAYPRCIEELKGIKPARLSHKIARALPIFVSFSLNRLYS